MRTEIQYGLEVPWIHADSSPGAFARFISWMSVLERNHLDHYARELARRGLAPTYLAGAQIGKLSGERSPLVLVELPSGGLEGAVSLVAELKRTRDYARRPVVVTGPSAINGEMEHLLNAGAFGYLDRSSLAPQEFARFVDQYTPRDNRV